MPHYVSTVDSGNLAGHLIVIKQACNELPERPLFDARVTAGLSDTIGLVSEELDLLAISRQRTDVVTVKQLRREIDACVHLITQESATDFNRVVELSRPGSQNVQPRFKTSLSALAHEHGAENFVELRFWIGDFIHQLEALSRDLHVLTPWAGVLAPVVSAVASRSPGDLSTRLGKISNELNLVSVPARIPELCDQMLVQLAALRPEAREITFVRIRSETNYSRVWTR